MDWREERGSCHALQCPSVPRASFARQEHLGTSQGLVTFSCPRFPVSPLLGGLPGVSVVSQALVKGIPTHGVGQQSNRNGDFTEVAPKSLYSSWAGHEAVLPPKQQPAARLAWLTGTSITLSLSVPQPSAPSKV